MADAIEAQVIDILAAQALLDPDTIAPDARLEALGLDSLGLVEAIFAIEEAFGVSVPFNANAPEASEFDISTVASVVAGVRRLVAMQS
ncbi:MAG: acyl carrier protein [Rhodobacter sp.]|jgi:acyl carrier protein|nr:acyl carrier protein [Rhodobacter sp.]MBK8438178.1 acyl carrier protein [Rhodobacter sp.]